MTAASMNPFQPPPRMAAGSPIPVQEPEREDLGAAVPVGEPEDEGFVIEEEDRESGPTEPEKKK